MRYAVFQNGIRQYRVCEGDEILVDKLGKVDKSASFDQVLLVVSDGEVKVGTPLVSGAKVEAQVLGEQKGEKIEVVKYKAKSRYRRHMGHRHQYTKVKVSKISS